MRLLFTILFLFSFLYGSSQTTKTIYLLPGQGADRRQFDSLTFDGSYKIKVIEYGTPHDSLNMKSFAKYLSQYIDTTEEFILIGVSLGGMLCIELSELLNPEKTIIISSAKNRNDFPARYTFQKKIAVYKLFPGSVLLAGAKILQPIVEPDRKKNKETFKAMLGAKDSKYMERSVDLIINWERQVNTKKIYQIHGSNDHTLTLRSIKNPDYIIENGSHMMTLTRAKEISSLLNYILLLNCS